MLTPQFDIIYPSWPIFHVPNFCEVGLVVSHQELLAHMQELHRWQDPAFAALLVAMCMLATRYSKDVRCRADPSESMLDLMA